MILNVSGSLRDDGCHSGHSYPFPLNTNTWCTFGIGLALTNSSQDVKFCTSLLTCDIVTRKIEINIKQPKFGCLAIMIFWWSVSSNMPAFLVSVIYLLCAGLMMMGWHLWMWLPCLVPFPLSKCFCCMVLKKAQNVSALWFGFHKRFGTSQVHL